jgi:hypothetical protein
VVVLDPFSTLMENTDEPLQNSSLVTSGSILVPSSPPHPMIAQQPLHTLRADGILLGKLSLGRPSPEALQERRCLAGG